MFASNASLIVFTVQWLIFASLAAITLDPAIFKIEATLSETTWSKAQTTAVKEEVITASLRNETIVPIVLELTPTSQENNSCGIVSIRFAWMFSLLT